MANLKKLQEIFPIIKVATKQTNINEVRELHNQINSILYDFGLQYVTPCSKERILEWSRMVCAELKKYRERDKKAAEIVAEAAKGYRALEAYELPTKVTKEEIDLLRKSLIAMKMRYTKAEERTYEQYKKKALYYAQYNEYRDCLSKYVGEDYFKDIKL